MEFGDRSRFGVSLDLNEDYGGAWLFGKICYWICGNMVGNNDEGTSLRDVLLGMAYAVGDGGKRYCPALADLEKNRVFYLIDAVLRDVNDEIYQYLPADFLPARFDVCIHVDVFDPWKIFLIDGDEKARILYRKLDSSEIEEGILNVGEFDRVVVEVQRYLDCLYDKELLRGSSLNP